MKKSIYYLVILLSLVLFGLPTLTIAQETNVVTLASGGDHTVALRVDGTVWTWGRNANGQLGDGAFTNKNVPTRVAMLRDIVSVAASDAYSLAVRADGTVWAWGWNANGQLGDGTTTDQPTPVQGKDPSDPTGFLADVIAVAAGERHSLALKANGAVWAWGYNGNGQLGDGTWEWRPTPVRVKDPSDPSGFLTGVKAIAAGSLHSIALKNDKTVWTWGSQGYNQLGRVSYAGSGFPPQYVAGQVAGMTNVKAIAGGWEHTVVLKEDGTVWAAGRNLEGQLGDGTTEGSFFPNPPSPPKLFVQVIDPADEPDPTGYLTGIIAIGADDRHTVAVKQNGSVYGWGWNYGGKLCDSTTNNKLTPMKMKDPSDPTTFLSGVDSVAAGAVFNLMLKEDGTIWGCGYNYYGQMGDGTWISPRMTPAKTQFPPASLVYVWGLNYISPGDEATFLVEYENVTGSTLQNAVAVFNIPKAFTYVSNTGGGVYWGEREQVFWKLGDLSPGARGQLTVKVNVPWGLELHSKGKVSASLGALSISSPFHVNEYLDYGVVDTILEKKLTPSEIATLLSQNGTLADLLHSVEDQGYRFLDVATQMGFSDGTSLSRLVLMDVQKLIPVFIHLMNGAVSAEKIDGTRYSLFDLHGGVTFDANDGTLLPWGTWAEAHSLSFSQCLFNCFVESIPSAILKKYVAGVDAFLKIKDCTECARTEDDQACLRCCNTVTGLGGADFKKHLKKLVCLDDCSDPDTRAKHICSGPKKECDPSGFWRWISTSLFEEDVVYVTACNTTLGGIYGATVAIQCAIGEVCNPNKPGGPDCDEPANLHKAPTSAEQDFEIRTSHDPNAKSADIKGDVLPGQTINYTVECENVGTGTAYGVFILDELDPNLDETTLLFGNPPGSYIASGRLISWDIGTLAAAGKGSRSFSVNVKTGLASGTRIVNRADVYFPSANEITPTNPVVHVVQSITADPQSVAATAGVAVSITLTGHDSGSGPLSYRVVSGPLYGTLAGVAPALTYTSMLDFSGQDEFNFVVNNGLVDSLPAGVRINVQANPADTNPPSITRVSPEDNAADVRADTGAVAANPTRYSPTILAYFSEPLDGTTVTTGTFTVESVSGALSGAVSYDEQTWSARFMPLAALAPGKTYTAKVKTGVKDKANNPLASQYVWHFSTGTPANAIVTFPEGGQMLNFGGAPVGAVSSEKMVTVTSGGTESLVISTLGKAGANPGDFNVIEDQCSGKTLPQFQSCTVKVRFQPSSKGLRTATLSIPSNDPSGPASAAMQGTGLAPDIQVNPGSLPFGNVLAGTSSDRSVTVRNGGDANLTLGTIGAPGGPFNPAGGTCTDNQTLPPQGQCTVTIRFSPATAGPFSSSFSIPSSDTAKNPVVVGLSGTGTFQNIEVDPASLGFGPVQTGTVLDKTVTVRNTGTADLTVIAIGAPALPFSKFGGSCTEGGTVAPGLECSIVIRFAPVANGTFNSSFTITSNDPDTGSIVVNLSGTGGVPDITVTPDVSFGKVLKDTSFDKTITVQNNGSAPLTLSAIGSPAAPFSVVGGSCTVSKVLSMGASCTIIVRFSPTVPGAAPPSSFNITSDDPDESLVTVHLSGKGVLLLVNPEEGTIGSQVTVTGSGFGGKKGKVTVGQVAFKVIDWTGDKIHTSLSKVMSPDTPYNVVVVPKEPRGVTPITEPGAFMMRGPKITSVTPGGGTSGSTAPIVIKGKFFGNKKGKVTLEKDGAVKSCKVLSWTMDVTPGEDEIQFLVPKKLATATDYVLKVTNKVNSYTTTFAVTAP